MKFEKVKQLINIIEKSEFLDFELDMKDEFYIKMSKNPKGNTSRATKEKVMSLENAYGNLSSSANTEKEDLKDIAKNISEPLTIMPKEEENIKDGNIVTSPIVGTFYSASSPDKPSYVKVGDRVKKR